MSLEIKSSTKKARITFSPHLKASKDITQKDLVHNFCYHHHVNITLDNPLSKKIVRFASRQLFSHSMTCKIASFNNKCLEFIKQGKKFKHIKLEPTNNTIQNLKKQAQAFFKRCISIKALNGYLTSTAHLSGIELYGRYLVYLNTLETLKVPLTITSMKDLKVFTAVSHLRKLKTIDATIVRFSSSRLEDLLKALGLLTRVEKLAITLTATYDKNNGRDQIISRHLSSLRNLKELRFDFQIISSTYEREYFTDLFVFLTSLRQIEKFYVAFEVNNPQDSVLILNFFKVLSFFDKLKSLTLSLSINIEVDNRTKKKLESLTKIQLKELKHLTIFSASSHDYFIVKTLVKLSNNLENLTIYGLSPPPGKEIKEFFTDLKMKFRLKSLSLDFKDASQLEKIHRLFRNVSKLIRLETLQVRSSLPYFKINEASLDKISKALKAMKSLKAFAMEAVVELNDISALKEFFKVLSNLNKLKDLELNISSKTVCEVDIGAFMLLIPRLEKLKIRFPNNFLRSCQYYSLFKEVKKAKISSYYINFAQTVLESIKYINTA